MNDFLIFKSFISINVLIVFYYIGAVLIPILIWQSRAHLLERFEIIKQMSIYMSKAFSSLCAKEQTYVKLLILSIFIFMEIIWRMMFEVMIAYFHMRDYLQQIAN